MYKKLTIGIITMLTLVSLSFAGVSGLTVKFTVNLAHQANLENFTPGTDSVLVRGNMNAWGGTDVTLDSLYSNDVDTMLYSGTFFTEQPDTMTTEGGEDSTFAWKYVIHYAGAGDKWEGVDNRELKWDGEFGEAATDTVWFDNVEYSTIQKTTVLFTVDMFVQIAVGNFSPDSVEDWLSVNGSFNGWTVGADKLTPFDDSNDETAVYTTKITKFFGVPENLFFKYYINNPGGNVSWESNRDTDSGNREETITGEETDLDGDGIPDKILLAVFFNDETTSDVTLTPVTITFHVDMTNAVDANDTLRTFNAATDSVYLAGGFNGWLTPPGAPNDWTPWPAWQYSDDDENGVYEFTHIFDIGTSRALEFKHGFIGPGISDLDNETAVGSNHVYDLVGDGPFDIYRTFSDMIVGIEDDNEGNGIVKGYELFQNYPNPFNPTTTIKFNVTKATDINLVIYNTLGQKVRTLFSGKVNAGTVSKVWDGNNDFGNRVSTGIYFYQLRSETGVITKKMTLLK